MKCCCTWILTWTLCCSAKGESFIKRAPMKWSEIIQYEKHYYKRSAALKEHILHKRMYLELDDQLGLTEVEERLSKTSSFWASLSEKCAAKWSRRL